MIGWLNTAALFGLSAAAFPVIVHLLLRQRAIRVVVPSVRFIIPSDEAAIRLRRPSDLLLLGVRIAVVACAALALGRPVLVTDGRRAAWHARTVRAIVVDTSASVDPAAAAEVAAAESRGVAAVRTFGGGDLHAATTRAAAWLRAAPPGRQELVIVSDFQEGTVSRAAFAAVPASAGLRAIRVARRALPTGEIDGGMILYGSRTYQQSIVLNGPATSFILRETGVASGRHFLAGGVGTPSLDALERTVATAGIFAPPPEEPFVVNFSAFAQDPDGFEAAAAVYEALARRRDEPRLSDLDTEAIPASTLQEWSRQPGVADGNAWRRSDESDGRWLWLAAILLLGVEAVLRRDRARVSLPEEHAA